MPTADNPFPVHDHGIDWCPETTLPNGEKRGDCIITPEERALVTTAENDTDAIADDLKTMLKPEPALTPERRAAHDAVASVLASIPSVRIGTKASQRQNVAALAKTALEQGAINDEVLILIAEAAVEAARTTPAARTQAEQAGKYRGMQDAIESVHYRFRMLTGAADMVNQAYHLIELSNAVGDLSSWHVSYDDHCALSWEREDRGLE